jgi:hypothetical protein
VSHAYDAIWTALSTLEPTLKFVQSKYFVSLLQKIQKYGSQIRHLSLPKNLSQSALEGDLVQQIFLPIFAQPLRSLHLGGVPFPGLLRSTIFRETMPLLESVALEGGSLAFLGQLVSLAPNLKIVHLKSLFFDPNNIKTLESLQHLEELAVDVGSLHESLVDLVKSHAKNGFRLKYVDLAPTVVKELLQRSVPGLERWIIVEPTQWPSVAQHFQNYLEIPPSSIFVNGFSLFPYLLVLALDSGSAVPGDALLRGLTIFHKNAISVEVLDSMTEALQLISVGDHAHHRDPIARTFWNHVSSQKQHLEDLIRTLPMLNHIRGLQDSALSILLFKLRESLTTGAPDELVRLIKLHFEALPTLTTLLCVQHQFDRSLLWALDQPAPWRRRYLAVNAITESGQPASCYLAHWSAKIDAIMSDPAIDVCLGGSTKCLAHHIVTNMGSAVPIVAVLSHKSMMHGVLRTDCILERLVANEETAELLLKFVQPLDVSIIAGKALESSRLDIWWRFLEKHAALSGLSRDGLLLSLAHLITDAALRGTISEFSKSVKIPMLLRLDPRLPALMQEEVDHLRSTNDPFSKALIGAKQQHLNFLLKFAEAKWH